MAAVGVATEPAGLGLAPTAARARRPHGAARRPIGRRRLVERHVTTIFEKLDLTLSENTHRRVLAVLAHLRAA